MTFPFEALVSSSRELGLVAGVLIGIGFGFVLERAGFGVSTKLAAQFYLRDMTVFKVMFSAIVTAMLGLMVFSGFGLVDLRAISESIASWTYLWPMLVGGLVLGVGFIVSGYCPGTSIVGAASGKIDGWLTVAGVVAGTYLYDELQAIPAFMRFHNSGEKGAWFLYDLIKIQPAVIAVAVAVMAVAAFAGAEKVEAIFGAKKAGASAVLPSTRGAWLRIAAPAFGAIAAFALIGLLIPKPASAAAAAKAASIGSAELARNYVAEPWRYTFDGDSVLDTTTNRTLAIAGGASAFRNEPLVKAMSGGATLAAAAPARPTGVMTAPKKKKGGGCSS